MFSLSFSFLKTLIVYSLISPFSAVTSNFIKLLPTSILYIPLPFIVALLSNVLAVISNSLTSFKTARIASQIPYIDKVLFVVDRKDLDYQTMREYDRFEKGAANSNRSTAILKKQLEEVKQEAETLKQEAETLKQEVESKNAEIESARAIVEEKEKEFIELNNTCHRLQSENDYLHNHLILHK